MIDYLYTIEDWEAVVTAESVDFTVQLDHAGCRPVLQQSDSFNGAISTEHR